MHKLSMNISSAALFFLLSGCAVIQNSGLWKQPEIKVSSIEISYLDFERTTLNIGLDISNPNPYKISAGRLDYSFKTDDKEIFAGEQNEPLILEPGKSSIIVLPLTFTFNKIFAAVSEAKDKDMINYVFSGGITLNVPGGGNIRIPFSASDTVPVPKIPQIKVERLKIEAINLLSAGMKLGIRVKNPNSFKINLKKYNYLFELDNIQIGSGKSDQGVSVGQGEDKLIEFPLNVSFANAGIALYRILTSGKSHDYFFKIEGEAGTDLDFMSSFPIKTEKKGKISLIK